MDKKILELIKARRLNAQILADKNYELALEIDGFKNAFSEYKKEVVDFQRRKAFGEDASAQKIEELKTSVNNLLKQKDLTLEDLKPQYSCNICADTGYNSGEVCECVNELIKQQNNIGLKSKNLKSFADANMEIFENPVMPRLYKAIQIWIKTPSKTNNILLQGTSGVGKTFLMECIASEFILKNKYVVFATAFELNNDFLKYHTSFDADKLNFINKYLECDVLLIDDLGTEPILRNVSKEYLYLITNQRMVNKKITIISTNLNLSEIRERYGERIFSRIINKEMGKAFQIQHSDLRLGIPPR